MKSLDYQNDDPARMRALSHSGSQVEGKGLAIEPPRNSFLSSIQGKFSHLAQLKDNPSIQMQSPEEEEELQGKFIQKKPMEEGKMAAQGKFIQFQKPEEEEELMQGKFINGMNNQSSSIQRKSSPSGGLPDSVRPKMESSLGSDFSSVKVHQNSAKATQLGALAYTQGNDVHFAPGQFKPDTSSGQELIGHELTHVVQQRQGRVQSTTSIAGQPVNDNKGLEKEADDMGKKAARGK